MIQSSRMARVQAPVIPIVGALVNEHPGTISLGQGLVSYGPPREALDAIRTFADDPRRHRYGSVEGEPALVDAITRKLAAENGIEVQPERRVVVTAGGNMAFVNAVLAVTDPGDEVILQAPFYFNHEMAVVIAGAVPVAVATDADYQLRLDAIRQAVTPRTRAVVTISPNNPTGAVYPEAALRELNAFCASRGLYHIHDEVYEYFTYDDAVHFSPGSMTGAAPHTISLFSLSKAYGFASWRIGYMVIPADLFEAVNKIQDTNLICPPLISQHAAVAALGVGRAYCDSHVRTLASVREMVFAHLDGIADLAEAPPVKGAFYVLLRVHAPMSPLALVSRLIREFGVAAIPGDAFGVTEGCSLRISFGALAADTVEEGMARLVRGLREIRGSERVNAAAPGSLLQADRRGPG